MKNLTDLIFDVVAAACAYRDFDWENEDPCPVVQRLDDAVDAYRKEKAKTKPEKP